MRRVSHGWLLAAVLAVAAGGCRPAETRTVILAEERRTLLIVLDGLRPDYLSPERMPNLHALAERGVVGEYHHAAYPTVTRVNAPSIATGALPADHGVLGNSIHLPAWDGRRVINTGDALQLMEADAAIGGLLTAPSLGEILAAEGRSLLIASSGSTGSAYLLNHRVQRGAVLNNELVLPDSLSPIVEAALGPTPEAGRPNQARNRRAVNAYLEFGLERLDPEVTILWLSDPDHTAHGEGVGSPRTVEALGYVDEEIGRIVRVLESRGLLQQTNIIVTSDHGFSTHVGTQSLEEVLIARGVMAGTDADDVVIAGDAIHVREAGDARVREIVTALQSTPWVGAIFTRDAEPGGHAGAHPGTFGFSVIGWGHERAADILISADWSDAPNEFGWPGTTWQRGTAGHGTASRWDLHATLIAAGPDFSVGTRSRVPTGHIDLAPTILHLHGIAAPTSMRGRILHELLRTGEHPDEVSVQTEAFSVAAEVEGGYRATIRFSRVGAVRYLDFARVERSRD
jgi:arylsulfatase A-like enzyme